jgi:hypothetical protein
MSLNTQMKAFKRAFEAGAPPGVLGAFHGADMALRQTNILERALSAASRTWARLICRSLPLLRARRSSPTTLRETSALLITSL